MDESGRLEVLCHDRDGRRMVRYTINPESLKDARSLGYNHAIVADGTFYVAGQVPMDADANIVGDDIASQARKAFDNVGELLEILGKGFSDVVKVTSHVIEPNQRYYDGYKVYLSVFEEPYPCHTVLGTHQLAHEDYLVEIEIEVPIRDEDVERLQPDGREIREI